MPDTTDNAKLVEELRKTHDRLLCNVADNGTRIKNETDYQADAEVALDVCWRAATALASANALNERLVAGIHSIRAKAEQARHADRLVGPVEFHAKRELMRAYNKGCYATGKAISEACRAILANLGEKETGR